MFSISPIAFQIFGISVRWYGIMIALGVFCAAMLVSCREKLHGLKKDSGFDLLLIALPAAIIGARLYYVVFSWEQFAGDPLQVFNLRGGGLALYGGLIGGIAAGLLYCRIRRIPIGRACDLAAPAIAIGQAFGRWGNFFNQEAYGAAVTAPSMQFFPLSVFIQSQQAWFYATFFYESVWCLLICIALLVLERTDFFRKDGDMLLWYGFLYAIERVCVEALRTDSLYIGSIRVSQALSAAVILVIGAYFLFRYRKFRALPLLLFALVLLICALSGIAVPFGCLVLLSCLQLAAVIYIYNGK